MMIEDNERADRLKDLSKRYDVGNRLCFSLADVKKNYDNSMNYDSINQKIENHRALSIGYLSKALS